MRPDPSEVIDPVVDRVWTVEVNMGGSMFVVAENEKEAQDVAAAYWHEEDFVPSSYYAWQIEGLLPGEASTIAWGRSFYQGKQLYLGDVLALIERKRPHYDTKTILMPWVESPPPYWLEEGE